MNTKQRLRTAHAGLDPVDLVRWCREALAEIERLETNYRSLQGAVNERYDRFFTAALQGILARSTAADLMGGKAQLVMEARRIADICVPAPPGEDS